MQDNNKKSETLLLACNAVDMIDKNKWYLDTGCSNHMLDKKELFIEFDESVHGEIKFGNNNVSPVYGKEKISISLKNWSTIFISDVFYVLGLHHNLLSVD